MRALVVVCRYLGDTLLATPLARALHEAGYTVDWLVAPGTAGIIENQPFAAEIHTLEPSIASTRQMIGQLKGRYDVACVINASDRPMLVAWLAAKKLHILTSNRPQDFWKRWLATSWIALNEDDHMAAYTADLARMAGVKANPRVGLEWSTEDLAAVRQKVLTWQEEKPFILIHPFARFAYKHWPAEQWRRLMQQAAAAGLRIAVTASPAEKEQAEQLCADLPADCYRITAGELSWAQLACLASEAACYIGLDTVNTHLAAATGVPTVALFGPTDPQRWGPIPSLISGRSPFHSWSPQGRQSCGNVILLQGLQGCVPCHREGCERHIQSDSACLTELSSERVWDVCSKLLEN